MLADVTGAGNPERSGLSTLIVRRAMRLDKAV